jgi:hypothetical protein
VTDVKKGDRVRVVVEGVATYCSSGGNLAIGVDSTHTLHTIVTNHPSVVSVEVLAKQFKVGDTVSGDDYAQLPVGTVLSSFDILTHKVGNDRWASRWGDCSSEYLGGPRKIAFLP